MTRLIDAEALKKEVKKHQNTLYPLVFEYFEKIIDNAPTVETKFELKTENGITYPKALDNMTFSHILSVEERQNIIQAYMLGANATARPHGKWIKYNSYYHTCDKCNKTFGFDGLEPNIEFYFCPNCGADMREDSEK